jgi:uracil-DNA glycosylase
MENIEINITNIRETLETKLTDSGWDKMLSPYINGLSFDHIVSTLVDNVENGRRFTPKFKEIFNNFYECKYSDLKVVIVTQDPYTQLGVADGIAFSCSKKDKTEKALEYMFNALHGDHENHNNDLRRWSNQGVLLLNTALTCEINRVGSHYGIWKSFTSYLFDNINRHNSKIIFVLMGKKAEEWIPLLSNQLIFKVAHPMSAIYNKERWEHKNIFNKVNTALEKQGKTCIDW